MNLQRDGYLCRFLYFAEDYIPYQTNLCRLFWRFTFQCLLVLGILGWVAVSLYFPDSFPASATFIIGSTVVMVFFIKWFVEWKGDETEAYLERTFTSIRASHTAQILLALKRKACPIITIER